MTKRPQDKTLEYNKVIGRDISIFPKTEHFCLMDGYYFNEDKTIFIKSSNWSGNILRNERSQDPQV